ncbi:MAG: ATP-binding protein [Alphaproteobacteria bacterium]|nr:ATP-binding protein [Alphaproteobacteria bacterium]
MKTDDTDALRRRGEFLPHELEWKRWVVPFGQRPLLDRDGFLNLEHNGRVVAKMGYGEVTALEDLTELGCLVLLGEPGSGKTRSIETSLPPEAVVARFDALRWSSPAAARDALSVRFEPGTPIIIDGLDESPLPVATLVGEIQRWATEFEEPPALRLCCRTGAWTEAARTALAEVFEEEQLRVVELAPLSWTDALEAFRVPEAEQAHLREVLLEQDLTRLAARPLTLGLLVHAHQRGRLGGNRSALMLEGCRALLTPRSQKDPDADTERRLALAARIAGVMAFSQRAELVLRGDPGDDGLSPRDLTGPLAVTPKGETIPVTARAVRALIESAGLFRSVAGRYTWIHRSFQDFLATRFLLWSTMAPEQIQGLLLDADGRVYPQLRELLGWFDGAFPAEVRRTVLMADPVAALSGDVASWEVEERRELLRAFLQDAERYPEMVYTRDQAKLAFEGVAEELRDDLENLKAPMQRRRRAMNVAYACETRSLSDVILEIALSEDEADPVIRRRAASWIARFGSDPERLALRPLLYLADHRDPDRDMMGAALKALQRANALTPEELTDALNFKVSKGYFGSYRRVMWELAQDWRDERFPDGHLLAVLRWSADTASFERTTPQIGHPLEEAALAIAVHRLDDPRIRTELTALVLKWHKRYLLSSRRDLWDAIPAPQRALFLTDVASSLDGDVKRAWSIGYDILLPDDLPLLLRQYRDATPGDRPVYLEWLVHTLNQDDEALLTALWGLMDEFQEVKERLLPYLSRPVDDRNARRIQARQEREAERQRLQAERRNRKQPSVEELLERMDHEGVDWWCDIVGVLSLSVDEGDSVDPWTTQIPNMPGWMQADSSLRERLLTAAKTYLHDKNPDGAYEVEKGSINWGAVAGLQALALLHLKDAPRLDELPETIWERWLPVLLFWGHHCASQELNRELLVRALHRNPAGALLWPSRLIWRMKASARPGFVRKLPLKDVPGLAECVLDWLRDGPDDGLMDLTEAALRHDHPKVVDQVRDWLRAGPAGKEDRWVAFAGAWLRVCPPPDVLSPLKQHLEAREDLEMRVLLATNHLDLEFRVSETLEPPELSWLVHRLFMHFPPSDDPERRGTHGMTPREEVRLLRNTLVRRLISLGTPEAVDALRDLQHAFPQEDSIRYLIQNAEVVLRRKSYRPPYPDTLLTLAADPDRRLVRHLGELKQLIGAIFSTWPRDCPRGDIWKRVKDRGLQPRPDSLLIGTLLDHLEAGLEARALGAGLVTSRNDDTLKIDILLGDDAALSLTVGVWLPWQDEPKGQGFGLALLLRSSSWRHIDDPERWKAAHDWSPEDLKRWCDAHGWVLVDATLDESESTVFSEVPFAEAALASLLQQGVRLEVIGSIGDLSRWLIALTWPDPLRERFGLNEKALLLLYRDALQRSDLYAAREHLRAHDGFDVDLLLVLNDAPDLERQLDRAAGRWGQWVALAPGEPLEQALAQQPRYDLYDIRFPVFGSQLFGREAEREEIESRVLRGESIVVTGLRKVGKTSLVKAVLRNLESARVESARVESAWVDVQAMGDRTGPVLRRALLRELEPETKPEGTLAELQHALRRRLEKPQHLVLVFDEHDLLFEGFTKDEPPIKGIAALLRTLRGLAQETGRLSMIFIGRDASRLEDPLMEDFPNPLLGWFKRVPMRPLRRGDAGALLDTLARRLGIALPAGFTDTAWRWTGGHPLLHRQLGSVVFELLEQEESLDEPQIWAAFHNRSVTHALVSEALVLLERRFPDSAKALADLVDEGATSVEPERWEHPSVKRLLDYGLVMGTPDEAWIPRVFSETVALDNRLRRLSPEQ